METGNDLRAYLESLARKSWNIVTLIGGPKCAGKSFYTDLLARRLRTEFGYSVLTTNFAGPIKAAAQNKASIIKLLQTFRLDNKCRGITNNIDIGELANRIYQMPIRKRLQYLGTEIGRDRCYPDVWRNLARQRLEKFFEASEQDYAAFIDDWRFPNEGNLTLPNHIIIVKVVLSVTEETQRQRGCDPNDKHRSELYARQLTNQAHFVIDANKEESIQAWHKSLGGKI